MNRRFTAIIGREGSIYLAFCPELDVASQLDPVSQARDNLVEAVTLFFESATFDEIERRLREEVYVAQIEAAVGWLERSRQESGWGRGGIGVR